MPEINYAAAEGRQTRADIRCIIRDVAGRLPWILALSMFVSLAVFVMLHELYTPSYVSRATLAVTVSGTNNTVLANLDTASDFAEVLSYVMDGTAMEKAVGAKTNATDFSVSAALIQHTNLIELTVSAPDPATAYRCARAALECYPDFTGQFIANAIVTVLREPFMPASVSNSDNSLSYSMRIFFLAALVLSLAVALRSFSKKTLKTEADADGITELKRLCTVLCERKFRSASDRFYGKNEIPMLITSPATGYYFAEAYKLLRSALLSKMNKRGHKTLIVTSVRPSEGKSTVSANLALAIAQSGKRVLLVDCDLYKPSLWNIFEKQLTGGMLTDDFIAAKTRGDAEHLPHHVKYPMLSMLLCEKPFPNTSERVINGFVRRFVKANTDRYDCIIIDTPPLSVCADAESAASFADEALLVVAQNTALLSEINDAAATLENCGTFVCGFVFNNVRGLSAAGFAPYGYGYGRYGYGRYGYGRYGSYGSYSRYGSYGKYGYGSKHTAEKAKSEDKNG